MSIEFSRDELLEFEDFLATIHPHDLTIEHAVVREELQTKIANELGRQKQEVEAVMQSILLPAIRNVRNFSATHNFSDDELTEIAKETFEHILYNARPFKKK